eukprot:GHVU01004357.1.p1 GENE.GHVU01004357.1~~GHVU01004357.1.p1  ORF type:complete len:272 (+),score=50.73 GHVU01004357.1:84-899(+)
MSGVPFEELKRLKAKASKDTYQEQIQKKERKSGKLPRPQTTNGPLECPSTRPVPPPQSGNRFHTKKYRDPRFSDLSGSLNIDLFAKSYAFLEDLADRETKDLSEDVRRLKGQLKAEARHPRPRSANGKGDDADADEDKGEGEDDGRPTHISRLGKKRHPEKEERAQELQEVLKGKEHMLTRLVSQRQHRVRLGELHGTKQRLRLEEKERVVSTGKTPYYTSERKVKALVKEAKREKEGARAQERRVRREDKKAKTKLPPNRRREEPKRKGR